MNTTNTKQLIQRYNRRESVLVISSYPPKAGESAKQNAVANYSRELVRAMAKQVPVVVIAEVTSKPCAYLEDDALIVRAYHKNSLLLTKEVLDVVRKFSRIETVMVQFEFNIFGGPIITASTVALFSLLKLMGKKTTFAFHQVVDDLNELSGHLGFSSGFSLKSWMFTKGMRMFYRMVGWFADGVVVHTDFLRERLRHYINSHKIAIVPHGVSLEKTTITQEQAKNKLRISQDTKLLLLFGYISWYKGTDWLIDQVIAFAKKYPQERIKLIVAGGPSATLKDREHYHQFLSSLQQQVAKHSQLVEITGYVPDKMKQVYFQAADVVIFPYRAAMSESGSMTHAFAYEKPFLVSQERFASFATVEMMQAMKKLAISPQKMSFSFDRGDFGKKLKQLLEDTSFQERLNALNRYITDQRSWKRVAGLYVKAMHKGYDRDAKVMNQNKFKLPELSVVVPLYNEAENVHALVEEALRVLPSVAKKFEVLLVNDGSADKTKALIKSHARQDARIKLVDRPHKGYGATVKAGMQAAQYEWVFTTDGDLQFDLKELHRLMPHTALHDMVLGYRLQRAEGWKRFALAKLLKIWNRVWLSFPMRIRDIDCAFKLINRRVINRVGALESDGAMLTTEFLLKAYQEGFSYTQVGVHHYPRMAGSATGADTKVIIRAVNETFRLRKMISKPMVSIQSPVGVPHFAIAQKV